MKHSAINRVARTINTRVTYRGVNQSVNRGRTETLVVKTGASVSHKTTRVNIHDMERKLSRSNIKNTLRNAKGSNVVIGAFR